jgi:hypothetical protein
MPNRKSEHASMSTIANVKVAGTPIHPEEIMKTITAICLMLLLSTSIAFAANGDLTVNGNLTVNGTFTASLPGAVSTNGYTTLPNGLILQWGTINGPAATAQNVAFPTPFPHACFQVQTTYEKTGGLGDGYLPRPYNITITGFTSGIDGYATVNPTVNKFWFAIGY